MYPIDAIKVCREPSAYAPQPVLTASNSQTRMQILNPTPSAVYNGMIHGTWRIATGEGIMSLWRGMSSVIVGAGEQPSLLCPLAGRAPTGILADIILSRARARRVLRYI